MKAVSVRVSYRVSVVWQGLDTPRAFRSGSVKTVANVRDWYRADNCGTSSSENVFHFRVINPPVNVSLPGFHNFFPIARLCSRVLTSVDPNLPDRPGFARIFDGIARIMDINEKQFDCPTPVFKSHSLALQLIFVLVFPTPFYLAEGD